ncbi:MAG: exosortase system-associated protein, TIGR04073 family [Candidatus Omnitrophota bacterium]|nr:exosortase system-associated protein, TIGR04073 family [Candidatus Omnitrophota bacterium]MBU1894559.1 exosortase system-associated protein, TIGR04073 family [Candidatus Omnitrophota bacterium]
MKRCVVFFVAIISTVFFIVPVIFAQKADMDKSPCCDQEKNPSSWQGKTGKALQNSVLSWTEIPKKIMEVTARTDPARGFLIGMFQGTCKAFERVVSGVAELATFPIGRYETSDVFPDMLVDK